MGPGSRFARPGRQRRGLGQGPKSRGRVGNAILAPDLARALESARIPLSFPPPQNEGDGAPKGACPGFRQGGPIRVRASPERRTLALMTRAPAPLDAPPRHLSAFAFTAAGPARSPYYSVEAARRPPGDVVA